ERPGECMIVHSRFHQRSHSLKTPSLASVPARCYSSMHNLNRTDKTMKTLAIALVTTLILGWSLPMTAAGHPPKEKLCHVVAFKFKEGTTKEHRNKGCTHGFILSFNSEKDRDTYINHPAHKEFGKLVGPLLDDVFVID